MNIKDKLINGEILVLDKILPMALFSRIKNKIDDSMLWKFTGETSLGSVDNNYKNNLIQLSHKKSQYNSETSSFEDTFSFGNNIFFTDNPNAQPKDFLPHLYESTELALAIALESIGLNLVNLIRIRAGMITYKNNASFHYPHIDMLFPHFNALLYLTTCNAPTRIYNETYNFDYKRNMRRMTSNLRPEVEFMHEKFNGIFSTKCEVDSVENRMVVFYGSHYHSSSVPVDATNRIVINYNFIA